MSKKSDNRLNKAEYKMTHSKSNESKPPKIAALVLLGIMLLSIIGFAMVGNSSNSKSQDYTNLPFGEYQTQQGSVWAAVINNEQFIFQEIDSLAENERLYPIAQEIKKATQINVYVDEGFENLDGAFLLEQKISNAFQIPVVRIQNLTCSPTTVVFTYNQSKFEDSNCIYIESNLGEEVQDSQALAYFLVSDFQG